jgi:hypothetical protein
VILTSGYPVSVWASRDAADLERLDAHSVAIIQKPFKAQVLPNTVREMIGIGRAERVRTA